ncbi:27869_t:CDS:2 [Gigaspora margarita]|uniref:27869_t:CDS:1 n=1 Tax=Gigaspora margarita TaxID=4874 RepID=A0ABN7UKS1_GIGMA|nr:27869_t:CDS:2 [Gigaspora margarita]
MVANPVWVNRKKLVKAVPRKVPAVLKEIAGFNTEMKWKKRYNLELKIEKSIRLFDQEESLIKQQEFDGTYWNNLKE